MAKILAAVASKHGKAAAKYYPAQFDHAGSAAALQDSNRAALPMLRHLGVFLVHLAPHLDKDGWTAMVGRVGGGVWGLGSGRVCGCACASASHSCMFQNGGSFH